MVNVRIGYDNGIVFVKFPYNKELIEIIKQHDAAFDWNKKIWKINLAELPFLKKELEEANHNVILNPNFKKMFKEIK